MANLTACLIVKNEAATIERVIECAKAFCDDVVVVDTGSTDDTKRLAYDAGAVLSEFKWCDDFSAARNHSFSQAKTDWIIWLDADDVVTPESQEQILKLMGRNLSGFDAIFTPYQLAFNRLDKPVFTVSRERFFRREAGFKWEGKIHESIFVPRERAMIIDFCAIQHRPPADKQRDNTRNLRILQAEYKAGDRSARTLFYYGNELFDLKCWEDAKTMYKEALETQNLQTWERYHASRRIATCCMYQGNDRAAMWWFLAAISIRPTRAEAYVELAHMFYSQDRYYEAIPFFTAATGCSNIPRMGESFVDEAHYTYLPWDYLSICYGNTGNFVAAIKSAKNAITYNHPDLERVSKNLAYFEERLAEGRKSEGG